LSDKRTVWPNAACWSAATITIGYRAIAITEGATVFGLQTFEHRRHPMAPRRKFALRMAVAIGMWFVLAAFGLAIGMAGYAGFEGMSVTDAYVNAAMILSGMGPIGELKTTAGKIFAGSYAIFSGLIIVIASSFVLAPIFHRVLHRFHVEQGKEE
jgi:hypothetical protein